MGAVGGLRRIKNAIGVARDILEHTDHSILVGELATQFAKELGYKEESLRTKMSKKMYDDWKLSTCQPNFWKVKHHRDHLSLIIYCIMNWYIIKHSEGRLGNRIKIYFSGSLNKFIKSYNRQAPKIYFYFKPGKI